MAFSFKSIFTPKSNETKEVQVVQLWYVRWPRFYFGPMGISIYHSYVMEAFTSEAQAKEFYQSLKAALILLKDDWRNITIEKN